MRDTDANTMLANLWFDNPVGHTIEALRYCLGYHRADPDLEISLILPSRSATELASFCSFVTETYSVRFDGLDNEADDPRAALQSVPRDWKYVIDDPKGLNESLLERFVGLRRYYDAARAHFRGESGRSSAGREPPLYEPHHQLLLELPREARTRAASAVDEHDGILVACMPAGSDDPRNYPSIASWERILTVLSSEFPDLVVCLVGKLKDDGRTKTMATVGGMERLRRACRRTVDCIDLPLSDQLAIIEACQLFISPHTGFGSAVLSVGTPWLTIAGGRWHEWFYNGVPFYSVLPDPERYPCYTWEEQLPTLLSDVDGEGPRSLSMSRDRIEDDLPELIEAARTLLSGRLTYEQALRRHFPRLLAVYGGDRDRIFTLDSIHANYL